MQDIRDNKMSVSKTSLAPAFDVNVNVEFVLVGQGEVKVEPGDGNTFRAII